jgi:hypothetical protein
MDGRTTLYLDWRRAGIALVVAAVTLGAAPAIATAADPEITRRPVVTGTAQVGQRLEARDARWTGGSSTVATYAWLRCTSTSLWNCSAIAGATGLAYTLTPADQGKRIRVWLTVSNSDGRDDDVSNATSVVAAAPAPTPTPTPAPTPPPIPAPTPDPPVTSTPPPVIPAAPAPEADVRETPLRMMRPFPLVRIRGWITARGAMIDALSVRGPRSLKISVRCHGRGCPRRSLARTAAKVTRLKAFEGFLPAGVRLEVRVTRPGFVGKHTLIRIRRGKAPIRRDRCLFPGSGRPRACPAN